MKESKVDLIKDVFSKAQYIKTINTDFNELGVTTIREDLQNQITVEDFFNYYNELFYDIPSEGEINSHRYLVEQSGGYINFNEINEEIEALREEITQLRQELLQSQMKNVTTMVSSSITPSESAEFNKLNSELSNITNQITDINLSAE